VFFSPVFRKGHAGRRKRTGKNTMNKHTAKKEKWNRESQSHDKYPEK
jgi:spore germination cell wall hydrolase CwlJ-like protein